MSKIEEDVVCEKEGKAVGLNSKRNPFAKTLRTSVLIDFSHFLWNSVNLVRGNITAGNSVLKGKLK